MKRILLAILISALLVLSMAPVALADDPEDPAQAGTLGSDVTGTGIPVSTSGDIKEVDPGTIPCANVADFEDVADGNYDGILVSGGLQFAERFAGQTMTPSGNFDVLSGTPSSPLMLQTGDPNDNVCVYTMTTSYIAGLGPVGYPSSSAIGEGSVALLFPSPQSQVKFLIHGWDGGGSATINFFRGDGTTVGTAVIVSSSFDQTYGFEQTGGVREIAGLSIHNDDPAGLAYDDFCYADPEEPEEPEIPVEVGGDVSPVNKVALLTPWIAIAAAILLISGLTLAVRRRIQS